MRIDTNGNVGIGTTTPNAALHVTTSGNYGLYLDTPSNKDQLVFLTSGVKKWNQYLVGNDLRFYDYTNSADTMTLQAGGNVGIGTTSPAAKFVVAPPATETMGANATITVNACGTVKKLDAVTNRTTDTTNTFTAPASANAGCCMDVINVDTADTITLDANTNFKTASGGNIALGPYEAVRVCSDGTFWYQMSAMSANQ